MPRVLIVEDDRAIRELLQFALECEGYEVLTRCDGREVVDLLLAMPEPCVVLMDLMMPWVDGYIVCQQIEEHYPTLAMHQVVVMTACWLEPGECPSPARAVIRKPFDLNEVLRLVAQLMALPPALPQPQSMPHVAGAQICG